MSDYVEAWEHEGLVIRISQDVYTEDPRKEWDHFGTMMCWHRRYNLGDEKPEDYRNDFRDARQIGRWIGIARRARVIIPLGLYDHSGLSMYAGGGPHDFDSQGWDSGTVGFIYATEDDIRREYGIVDDQSIAHAERALRLEIDEYDQYLRGDVYGWIVETKDGDVLDSLSGVYGYDYACQEARRAAESIARDIADQASYVQWVYA